SDPVVSAVLRQYGVTRVDGLDELLDTAALFARAEPPAGDGVCVYSISGGTSAHLADLASAGGLRLPDLTPRTQERLREWIPGYLRISNPVDNGGHPTGDWRGRRILDALVADPNVDVLVVPITGAFPPMSDILVRDLVDVAGTTDKPICVIWGSPVGTEAAYRDVLLPSGLPVFRTFGNCVRALRAYFDFHAFRRRYRPAAYQATPCRLRPGTLSEPDAKALLTEYKIEITRDELVTSPSEAATAAARLGTPVVLKIVSADLPHKSDLGLVRLDVHDAASGYA